MWNPVKIFKLTSRIWTDKVQKNNNESHDEIGNQGLITELYGQFQIPYRIQYYKWAQKTGHSDILNASGKWSRDFQDNKYIPMLMDQKKLSKLSPNTLGAHVNRLYELYDFEKFWQGRFDAIDKTKQYVPNDIPKWFRDLVAKRTGVDPSKANLVRTSVNRHHLLSHDFWHVLFRYDTNYIGEMCIQAVTAGLTGFIGAKYLSWVIAARESVRYKTLEPLRLRKEALNLGKQCHKDFYWTVFDEMLDTDIEEVRAKFNIHCPARYLKFIEKKLDPEDTES